LTTANHRIAHEAGNRHHFTKGTWQVDGTIGPYAFAVTRVDSKQLWAPAVEPESQTTVLLAGRPAFEEADWKRAELLPFEGGLCARLILEKWLADPTRLTDNLNGAFAVIIVCGRNRTAHVVTDRLGIFPLYSASCAGEFFVGSHTDIIADSMVDVGCTVTLDCLTLGEVIATGCATQPYTYYREIYQLEPAAIYRIDQDGSISQSESYWQPAYWRDTRDAPNDTIVEELAESLSNAVRRRTLARLGTSLVMLSGGADSRCALFGASDPSAVRAMTLCDEPNAELATARTLARAAGASHHVFLRHPEYYIENAGLSMRIAGGMWNLIDAHYTGAAGDINGLQPGTILTGCYADYMFKGLMFNRRHRHLFGRALPIYELAGYSPEFYHPHVPLREAFSQQVSARHYQRFKNIQSANYPTHALKIEDLRLRPLSREPDAAGRLWLLRTQPWDPFLADTDVLGVYEKLTVNQKLNGIVFGRSVARVCGTAAEFIPNNNYGAPVGSSEHQRIAWFLWSVLRRKVRNALRIRTSAAGIATPGSWPNWSYLIRTSPLIAEFWSSPTQQERDLYVDVFGADPWLRSPNEWANTYPAIFFRIMSSLIWLRQRRLV
jgi:asparagine synthase (glutamine-hydrolysing)